MNCPKNILELISGVLKTGILRIRNEGYKGNSTQCAIEADHIHNLPELLINYSEEQLKYYLETETRIYVKNTSKDYGNSFEPYWKELDKILYES